MRKETLTIYVFSSFGEIRIPHTSNRFSFSVESGLLGVINCFHFWKLFSFLFSWELSLWVSPHIEVYFHDLMPVKLPGFIRRMKENL